MARMEKRSRATTPWDEEAASRPGWEDLRVWWLISKDETGTSGVLMNVAEFPPHKSHEVHRHKNAPEILYVEDGSGLLTHDGPPIRIEAGEVVIHPAGEWHGFYNDTGETTKVVCFWPEVDNYSDLDYEVLPDWEKIVEEFRRR